MPGVASPPFPGEETAEVGRSEKITRALLKAKEEGGSLLQWTRGSWGKGFIMDDGTLVTWNTSAFGAPIHLDVIHRLVGKVSREPMTNAIVIHPNGAYTFAGIKPGGLPEIEQRIWVERFAAFAREQAGLTFVRDSRAWAKIPIPREDVIPGRTRISMASGSIAGRAQQLQIQVPSGAVPKGLTPAQMSSLEQQLALNRQLIRGIEDDAARAIADDWGRVTANLEARLRALMAQIEATPRSEVNPQWLYRQERYQALLRDLERGMREFTTNATGTIYDAKSTAIRASETASEETTTKQLAPGDRPFVDREAIVRGSFNRMNPEWVTRLSATTAQGTPIGDYLGAIAGDAEEAFRDTLMSGVARGQSMRAMARDIQLASNVPFRQVLSFCRNSVLGVYRETAIDGYKASSVVKGWVWDAACDDKTCDVCWSLHGEHFPDSEPMESHGNCRCMPIPETYSWDELGFPGITDTQPALQTGEGGFAEPGVNKFERAPESTQRAVLGPSKFAAYKDGKLNLKDLPVRTTHPVWGRGYRSATLKELGLPRVRTPTPKPRVPKTRAPVARGRSSPAVKRFEDNARNAMNAVHKTYDPKNPADSPAQPHAHLLPKSQRVSTGRGAKYGDYGGWLNNGLGQVRLDPDAPYGYGNSIAVHEYGHWVDNKLLPTVLGADRWATARGAIYASGGPGGTPMRGMNSLMRAIKNSPTYKGLRSRDDRYGQYLAQEHESFARAYAQWIGSHPKLVANDPVHLAHTEEFLRRGEWCWGASEFRPIAAEFEKLFKKLGLLEE